jgi:hypothetical protein
MDAPTDKFRRHRRIRADAEPRLTPRRRPAGPIRDAVAVDDGGAGGGSPRPCSSREQRQLACRQSARMAVLYTPPPSSPQAHAGSPEPKRLPVPMLHRQQGRLRLLPGLPALAARLQQRVRGVVPGVVGDATAGFVPHRRLLQQQVGGLVHGKHLGRVLAEAEPGEQADGRHRLGAIGGKAAAVVVRFARAALVDGEPAVLAGGERAGDRRRLPPAGPRAQVRARVFARRAARAARKRRGPRFLVGSAGRRVRREPQVRQRTSLL